jgi:tetratricopeptide (TPR) repeat protein
LLLAALGARTYARNADWLDEKTLWSSAVRISPNSLKTHLGLAPTLVGPDESGIDDAVREADQALAIVDPLPDERNNSGVYSLAAPYYRRKGDTLPPSEAAAWYHRALNVLLRGERVDLYWNQVIHRENQLRGRIVPDTGFDPLYLELGRVYLRLSDPAKALEALRYGESIQYGRALTASPEFVQEMSKAYSAAGDLEHAAVTLMEGVSIDPGQTAFASQLVDVYKKMNPQTCALQQAGGSVSLNLDCPLVRTHLCTASRNVVLLYLRMHRLGDAAAARNSAIASLGCPAGWFQ